MQSVQVAELKAKFSHILGQIKNKGEEYVLEYGKNHEKVAVIIPYEKYKRQCNRKITFGLLQGRASFTLDDNFSLTDEELLAS